MTKFSEIQKITIRSTTIIANTNKMIAELQKLQPNGLGKKKKKKVTIQ